MNEGIAEIRGFQVEDNGHLIPDVDYVRTGAAILSLEGKSSIGGELHALRERELGEIFVDVYDGRTVGEVKEKLRDIGRCERDRELIDELEQKLFGEES